MSRKSQMEMKRQPRGNPMSFSQPPKRLPLPLFSITRSQSRRNLAESHTGSSSQSKTQSQRRIGQTASSLNIVRTRSRVFQQRPSGGLACGGQCLDCQLSYARPPKPLPIPREPLQRSQSARGRRAASTIPVSNSRKRRVSRTSTLDVSKNLRASRSNIPARVSKASNHWRTRSSMMKISNHSRTNNLRSGKELPTVTNLRGRTCTNRSIETQRYNDTVEMPSDETVSTKSRGRNKSNGRAKKRRVRSRESSGSTSPVPRKVMKKVASALVKAVSMASLNIRPSSIKACKPKHPCRCCLKKGTTCGARGTNCSCKSVVRFAPGTITDSAQESSDDEDYYDEDEFEDDDLDVAGGQAQNKDKAGKSEDMKMLWKYDLTDCNKNSLRSAVSKQASVSKRLEMSPISCESLMEFTGCTVAELYELLKHIDDEEWYNLCAACVNQEREEERPRSRTRSNARSNSKQF